MEDGLDIAEVARRTGLSSRALRFYEARGLVRPLRTQSGRRLYGRGELDRLNQVVTLKRAGFTLVQIQRLLAGRPLDLGRLVAAQLDAFDAKACELEAAREHLHAILSRLDRGEPIDSATLCSLIRYGDQDMESERWKRALAAHYTPEELAHWQANPPPADFDMDDYHRRWEELAARIEAAMPLDPASEEAQSLLAEWEQLLEPFMAMATPEMKAGAGRFWANAQSWQGEVGSTSWARLARFIEQARAARAARR